MTRIILEGKHLNDISWIAKLRAKVTTKLNPEKATRGKVIRDGLFSQKRIHFTLKEGEILEIEYVDRMLGDKFFTILSGLYNFKESIDTKDPQEISMFLDNLYRELQTLERTERKIFADLIKKWYL